MAAAMSDMNHPLAAGIHPRMNDNHGGGNPGDHSTVAVGGNNNGHLLENGSAVVSEVIPTGFGAGKTSGAPLGMPVNNASDDSLALGLNLALVPEALHKNFNSTPSNTTTRTGNNSTGTNSGNNSTMPTPLTMSNGNTNSVDNSNPGTNKTPGMSGLRGSLHSMGSDHSSPIMSSDISTNTMRMFQRMDEISARLIAMEEMFQKLCKSVEQQNSTISNLKLDNERMSKDIIQRVESIPMQRSHHSDTSAQDTFVTDLLNSITNVSSAYLRRMRPHSHHNRSQFDSMPPKHTANEIDSGRYGENDDLGSSNHYRNFGDRQSGHPSFTLNPNGIKRRKKNDISSDNLTTSGLNSTNMTSAAQSYKDLTSLNAFGTISLPNLTLENTGMTPPLRNGNQGLSFTRVQDAGSSTMLHHGQGHTQTDISSIQHNQVTHPLKNTVSNQSQNGNGKPQDDDDEGYQEDDDDDNESDGSDEDDEDEEIDDDMIHRTESMSNTNVQDGAVYESGQQNWRVQVVPNSSTSGKGNAVISQNSGNNNTQDKQKDNQLKHGKGSSEVSDMNYTLLKAPSNVRTIWDEYTMGIRGHPPIKRLEERFGNKWRLNRNRKTYARRKRLYKFIINGINKGKTADEMINTLEERRLYKDENGEVKRRTIGWLQQSLTGI